MAGGAGASTNGATMVVARGGGRDGGIGGLANPMTLLSDLQDWAEEEIAQNPLCMHYALACVGEESESVVTQRAINRKAPVTAEEISALVAHITERYLKTARSEVDESPRAQTYILVAFGKGKNDFLGRRKFTLHPPLGRTMNADVEAPTEKGVMTHAMRWSDNALRLGMTHLETANQELRADIRDKCNYIKQLEDRRLEEFKLREEMASKALERDLALGREKRSDERIERIFRQVEGYLPAIAQKYLGAGTVPTAASPAPDAEQHPVDAIIHLFMALSDAKKKIIFDCMDEDERQQFLTAMRKLVMLQQAAQAEKTSKKTPAAQATEVGT